jgi:hypothetical protein
MNDICTVHSSLLRLSEDALVAAGRMFRVGVGKYSLSGIGICRPCILEGMVEERLKGSVQVETRAINLAINCRHTDIWLVLFTVVTVELQYDRPCGSEHHRGFVPLC